MKKIIRKLRSRHGESLVESMAAILIFTLSSIMLLSVISSAAKVNRSMKAMDRKMSVELKVAEMQEYDTSEYPDMRKITDQNMTISYGEKVCKIKTTVYDNGEGTFSSFTYQK